MFKLLFIANWKMHGSVLSIRKYFENLEILSSSDVVVMPPAIFLRDSLALKMGSLELGIQNVWTGDGGAYTGEISANMAVDLGVRWVLVGHSERRKYQQENDELIQEKVACSLKAGLNVILCVGETIEERNSGFAQKKISDQLEKGLKQVVKSEASRIVIAYEPVWAIGTGNTATEKEAQRMHSFIRLTARNLLGESAAELRIVYGGSVKTTNAASLLSERDINGLLVGGASLEAKTFSEIVNAER